MENEHMGCIIRDKNVANNMIKIVNHYLYKKERSLKYRRELIQKVVSSNKKDTAN